MGKIQILDKTFKPFLTESEIAVEVKRMAAEISRDFNGKDPIMIPQLVGSFMFAADLLRNLTIDPEVAFVRYSSYSGTASTGRVNCALGFPKSVEGRHVVIVEDIVETGLSMQETLKDLWAMKPASVSISAFFYKPNRFRGDFKVDYVGKVIEDDFIVGYGLDYNGHGRCLREVYQLDNE